ncbi:unknown [Prevotella sp. CAG:1320]|nr:unknown [Prevotella sp. CAG:1320]
MDLRSTALCIYICTSIGWRLHVDAIVYLSGLFSV